MQEVERIVFVTHPTWPAVVPRYQMQFEGEGNIVRKGNLVLNLPVEGQEERRNRSTPKQLSEFFEKEVLASILKIKGNFIIICLPTAPVDEYAVGLDKEFVKRVVAKHALGKAEFDTPEQLREFEKTVKPKLKIFYRARRKWVRKAAAVERNFFRKLNKQFAGRVFVAKNKYGMDEAAVAKETSEIVRESGLTVSRKALVIGMGAWAEGCARYYPRAFARTQKLRSTVARRAAIPMERIAGPIKKYSLRRK